MRRHKLMVSTGKINWNIIARRNGKSCQRDRNFFRKGLEMGLWVSIGFGLLPFACSNITILIKHPSTRTLVPNIHHFVPFMSESCTTNNHTKWTFSCCCCCGELMALFDFLLWSGTFWWLSVGKSHGERYKSPSWRNTKFEATQAGSSACKQSRPISMKASAMR